MIADILKGIDGDEITNENGWWETSAGASFGREKLIEAQGYEAGLLQRITELEAQLETAKNRWIPVSERLPEPESECFVWAQSVNGKHSFAYPTEWTMQREAPDMMYPSVTVEIGYGWDDFDFEKVSHWMYQPKPPIDAAIQAGEV